MGSRGSVRMSTWRRTGASPRIGGDKKWKGKIQWGLLEVFDLQALETERNAIQEVEEEAHVVAEKERRFEQYTTTLGQVAPGATSNVPRVIAHEDGPAP